MKLRRSGPPARKTRLAAGSKPLSRSAPLGRGNGPARSAGSSLARSGGLAAGKGPAARSGKRVAEQATRRELGEGRPGSCDLGPAIRRVDPGWAGCRGRHEAWHERRKSGAAGSRVNPRNLVAACNPCNGWVEDEPPEARRVVLADGRTAVVREGDPEWPALSKRHDRRG